MSKQRPNIKRIKATTARSMTASSLSNVNDNHNDDIVDYYDIHNGNGDNRDRNECLRVLRAGFSTRVSYE